MPALPAIVNKEYLDQKEFNRDAQKMAAQGYRVVSVRDGKTDDPYYKRYFQNPARFMQKKRILVTYQLG